MSTLRTDPVMLEVLRNRFKAVAEEMAAATLRTAFTVFVKETHDFGACIASAHGDVFAAPTDTAVSVMAGLPAWELTRISEDWEEGDIAIANDPESTRGLSTHLPDIWLWKPIFSDGKQIAVGLSFIHSSDVGGKVAGSISPTSYEIVQEGIRIPPMKLFHKGELDQGLLEFILLNCHGVVLAADRAVDLEATQERRRAARPETRFAFGPERSAYELRRSEALADAVVEQVDPFPPSLRHLVRRRLDMRLDGLAAASPQDVPALVEDIQRELGIGRRAAVAVEGAL